MPKEFPFVKFHCKIWKLGAKKTLKSTLHVCCYKSTSWTDDVQRLPVCCWKIKSREMAQLQKKLSVFGIQLVRQISTTACVSGKRNFRKFPLYNKRGTKVFKAQQFKKPDPNIPIYGLYLRIELIWAWFKKLKSIIISDYGARPIGYVENGKFVKVPEMIPEIMVPDLTGFQVCMLVFLELKHYLICFFILPAETICFLSSWRCCYTPTDTGRFICSGLR